MSKIVNEVGNRYGRLTVISRTGNNKQGKAMWLCRCDCGVETIVVGRDLRRGATKSCGCLQKERVSKTNTGRTDMCGKDHPNWKGGITPENRIIRTSKCYKNWRIEVFERDNYTCQKCNKHGGNLVAHHLEAFNNKPELRTTVSNGATLCKRCHKNFHHQYGYGDNTREQFEEFLSQK